MNVLHSTAVEFDLTHHSYQSVALAELDLEHRKDKIYWIHSDLQDRKTFNELAKKLPLPDYVIELCLSDENMPKLIDMGEAITICIQCLQENTVNGKEEIRFANLIIHLTPQYCFTATNETTKALLSFTENYHRAINYAKTPCFILFLILDNAINDYSEVLLDYELMADQMDLKIREVQDDLYNEVMAEKKEVMRIKRYAAAIRDILMRISGRKIAVISEQCRASLLNLFDHSQMLIEEADAIRDILKGTLDQIDNALMQRMNKTMRVLTAFAAIFLPLSLIAGVYGMNFNWIPELHWKYGYFWALFLMIVCGSALLYFFKKMKWF